MVSAFDGNDYRKRVLAPVEARGGLDNSDPFEVYDLPIESVDQLTDAEVATQLALVWAFWQKQRDHPKFRGLVTALLASHDDVSAELASASGRRELANRTQAFRDKRDADRFAELDAALGRLAERFGGLPRSKVDGLRSLAARAGVDDVEFERRIRRYRLLDNASEPEPLDLTAVYRQVRADLDELGQLRSAPPPASLYALIGLPPGVAGERVRNQRDALAARNRERRPDRHRALIDDLLAAVTSLLIDRDPNDYLDALGVDVAAQLRPRVAAAILVEDALTVDDHAHLLAAAEAGGLDRARAERVLAELAREHGVAAPDRVGPAGVDQHPAPARSARGRDRDPSAPARPPSPPSGSTTTAWSEELSRARAAVRAGLLFTARRQVLVARERAGQMLPPIRALSDEIERLITEAAATWRTVEQALSSSRLTEALALLDGLAARASDTRSARGKSVDEVRSQTRQRLEQVDQRFAATRALSGAALELALLELVAQAPDHAAARAALTALPVAPATAVSSRRVAGGVVLTWRASTSVGVVNYRVLRRAADGSTTVVGSTGATAFETSAPEGPLPVFMVVARRAGVEATSASSAVVGAPAGPSSGESGAGEQPAAESDDRRLPPITELAIAPYGQRLRLVYPPPPIGRAEVRRLGLDGRPPAVGSLVSDPDALGPLVVSMAPGLAMDRRPVQSVTRYVVLTVDARVAVAGVTAVHVNMAAAAGLTLIGARLTWTWPPDCTEVVVAWRLGGQPTGPDDPQARRRKITNARYEIDGGLLLPDERPLMVTVFGCVRDGATLHVDSVIHPSATTVLA